MTAFVAVLVLGLPVAGTLIAVNAWSGQRQDVLQAVSVYRLAVTTEHGTLNSADQVTAPQLRDLQRQAGSALAQLQSTALSDSMRGDVVRLDQAYQAAATQEIDEVAAWRPDLASHTDLFAVDPSFVPLDQALGRAFDEASSGAKLGAAVDDVVSVLVVVAAAALTVLTVVLARRRRERVAAASARAASLVEAAHAAGEAARGFRTIFDRNPQPMLVAEVGGLRFLAVNDAALALYGYDRDEFLTLSAKDLRVPEEAAELQDTLRRFAAERQDQSHSSHHRTKRGAILSINVEVRHTDYEGREVMLVCIRDMTAHVALQGELEHRAFHDGLTGLPNRELFRDRLEHAHRRLERSSAGYVVMMLDLDDFKMVNDGLGHGAGDELLAAVASRLRAAVRSGDTAARLGGDEFAILIEDMDDVSLSLGIADHVLDALRPGFAVADRIVTATATIGIAGSAPGTPPWDVVRNADTALYAGKARGKGRHELFSVDMHVGGVDRLTIEWDLRLAISRNELLLHYQPKVDTYTGRVLGVEALVRWQHPIKGLIPPYDFIPLAEESGLITEVDDWVLLAACRQASQWWQWGVGPVPVAVNVSGRDVETGDFGSRLRKVLALTGLPPSLLELEITESTALRQEGKALAVLEDVRSLGVRVAMDDFGTGYSILSRLQGFPMDSLKIDMSFVQRITSASAGAPIVAATIVMGHELGLTVVAEGVETEAQRQFLADHGCDQLQGYLMSRPVTAEQILPLLRRSLVPRIPERRLSPHSDVVVGSRA